MKLQQFTHTLCSFSYTTFPFSLREEGEDTQEAQHFQESSGLTLSEDKKCFYVEASVPGHTSEEIEITFEQSTLWIRGIKKEEPKEERNFYRRAKDCFSYRVAIPADIDEKKTPKTECKNGILRVIFMKKKKSGKKKLKPHKQLT